MTATPPAALAGAPGAPSEAGPVTVETMRNRPQFLAASRARRQATPSMVVQGRNRSDGDPVVHVGFTCSKKVGNAVQRNRAKRRLRAAARAVLPPMARPGWDYVLIGRHAVTAARGWPDLCRDLESALSRLHA